jgi:hypothetical protein
MKSLGTIAQKSAYKKVRGWLKKSFGNLNIGGSPFGRYFIIKISVFQKKSISIKAYQNKQNSSLKPLQNQGVQ